MSSSIFLFFFLSLFFISSTSFSFSSVNATHKCSLQQALALLHFKQNLSSINDTTMYDYECKDWLGSDYKPVMMNWNTSTDCCDWNGVTCDHSTGDVVGLYLSCGMVLGTIHPNTTLFHLPRLQRLNLAYNYFFGSQLPPDISRVSNSLTHLNISNSWFTGQVPTDISHLHKLVSLDLSSYWNDLILEPHVFINLLQNLTVMKELSLSEVSISAVLPSNLNISSSLRLLSLHSTGLQGNLPHTIFNLQSLEILDLATNSLTGHIPPEISLLPKLVELDLTGNNNLLIQPHVFSNLLKNSTFLRDLRLSWTSLQGKLPDNILNLKYLEQLDLSGNKNVSGPLPKVNTSTTIPLWLLDLSKTSLSGEIQASIGHLKSLFYLDLWDCGLNGSLPKSLGNLKYLKLLYLSNNKLSGTLPSSLFSLQFLKALYLANNQLTGQIDVLDNGPDLQTFQRLTNLTHLDLSYNNFTGEIQASISHLKSLVYLDLSYCGLNGSLPKSLGNLRYLKVLDLSSNMLSGTLPSSLFSLQSLEALFLANNQLTGQIDVLDNGLDLQKFQRLTNLTYLDLSYNNFTGEWELETLLSCLTNLGTLLLSYSGVSVTTSNGNHSVILGLQILSLASCSIKVFPVSIRAMANLMHLDLSNNDIQGHIPDWIGEIGRNQLSFLDLSNNSISGTIPNAYEHWSELEGFVLKENQLKGRVPISLYKCQKLRIIDLGNNQLSDTFPGWFGDLPYLQALILRSNNFHGGIVTSSKVKFPFQSLRVLDLSHNGFVGQLPTKYFQKFNAMKNVVKHNNTKPEYVNIGGMYYSIIVAVKGVDLYITRLSVDYIIVDLSENKFEGEIANIIGNLKFLKVLNLSHNSLTGQIPHALGDISEIESLDLSWNKLTGEIPQSLADLTFLECLNLSQNHLLGHIPQGKQFNTFDGNSFGGNPKLCGLPLPNKCSEHLQKPQPEGDVDEVESGFTWKVVMMGYGCGTFLGFVLGLLMLSTGRPKWFIAIADVAEYVILTIQDKRT